MSQHPLNLALRFMLELIALGAMGYWGWTRHPGWVGALLGIGIPLVAAVLWGTFRVPGDPARAPVPVPGLVRLLLEIAFFGVAAWMLITTARPVASIVIGAILLHYALSFDRILLLLRGPRTNAG